MYLPSLAQRINVAPLFLQDKVFKGVPSIYLHRPTVIRKIIFYYFPTYITTLLNPLQFYLHIASHILTPRPYFRPYDLPFMISPKFPPS